MHIGIGNTIKLAADLKRVIGLASAGDFLDPSRRLAFKGLVKLLPVFLRLAPLAGGLPLLIGKLEFGDRAIAGTQSFLVDAVGDVPLLDPPPSVAIFQRRT